MDIAGVSNNLNITKWVQLASVTKKFILKLLNIFNYCSNTIETDDDNSLDDEDGYDPLPDEEPAPPRSRHLSNYI